MAYLTESLAELWLDDLNLMGETTDDDGHTFCIDALGEDATWDNPVPVDVSVHRWMTDGAVASTQGHENRSPYFKVKVSASTSAGLAAGESALVKRSGKPRSLSWTPPEGAPDAATSVFEVWTWHLEHVFDGLGERRLERMYGLRMTAKPWVRSADLTVVDALPTVASPTITGIDTCASTSGWTGAPNAPSASGGALHVAQAEIVGSTSRSLTRTGTVSGLGSTPYLIVNSTITGGTATLWTVNVDGTFCEAVATIGTSRYFALPDTVTSFSTLIVGALVNVTHAGTVTLNVNDVSATDTIGGIGSHKQMLRGVEVGGSVPTSGSIEIASPDATALGWVLAYTFPDTESGYAPPMRPWRVSGNTLTADASAVSGQHEALVTGGTPDGPITYTLPAATLAEGTYAVVGRFQPSTTDPLTVTVTAGNVDTITASRTIGLAGGWAWMVVGVLALPTFSVPDGSQMNQTITLSATHAATVILDELYLFNVTTGDLTLVASGANTYCWIDAPDADPVRNRPAIYLGNTDDRSDAATAWGPLSILAVGDHDLDPGGSSLFTVTDGVNDAVVTASYYPRWHTHAGA